MNYFDIIIIVVLGLFFIYGLFQGFMKPFIAILGLGLSATLIFFFAGKLGNLLASTGMGESLANVFSGWMPEAWGGLGIVQGEGGLLVAGSELTLSEALKQASIPTFMQVPIISMLVAGQSLAGGVAIGLARYVCVGIAALIILVVVSIIFKIISLAICQAVKGRAVVATNRIVGAILYLVIAYLVICGIMWILDAVADYEMMQGIVKTRNEGVISGFFGKYNLINIIINGGIA